jgi:hypothetical protein
MEGDWEWSQPWIAVGLAVFGTTFVGFGLLFYVPHGRLDAAVERLGVGSPEALAVGRRIDLVTWLELPLLVLALFAMTVKPTL